MVMRQVRWRMRIRWWSGAAVATGLIAGGVWAQPPDQAPESTRRPASGRGFSTAWSIIRPTRSMTR